MASSTLVLKVHTVFCVHDHSISENSFTNHLCPSLWTGTWLCPPEWPHTTHKLLEKAHLNGLVFSSPFTNFFPKVPRLKSISWRHMKHPRISTWPKHYWRSAVRCQLVKKTTFPSTSPLCGNFLHKTSGSISQSSLNIIQRSILVRLQSTLNMLSAM